VVLHDFLCPVCNRIEYDAPVTDSHFTRPCICGSNMEIYWNHRRRPYIGIHPRDRAVVWYNPETGKHATPGRSDVDMPERYRQLGYVRREFETLRDLDKHCTRHGLVNHRASYDGSGRGYDDVDHIYPEDRGD